MELPKFAAQAMAVMKYSIRIAPKVGAEAGAEALIIVLRSNSIFMLIVNAIEN